MPWPTTSRQSRGYGRAWELKRLRILRRDKYLCQCRHCKAEGRVSPASEVDHIVSKAKARSMGWTEAQIDADSNLQSINRECHRRKTIEDEGRTIPRRIGADGFPLPEGRGGR